MNKKMHASGRDSHATENRINQKDDKNLTYANG